MKVVERTMGVLLKCFSISLIEFRNVLPSILPLPDANVKPEVGVC